MAIQDAENGIDELLLKFRHILSDLQQETHERIKRENEQHDSRINEIYSEFYYKKRPIETQIEAILKQAVLVHTMKPVLPVIVCEDQSR